jgi:hypothetical protein
MDAAGVLLNVARDCVKKNASEYPELSKAYASVEAEVAAEAAVSRSG